MSDRFFAPREIVDQAQTDMGKLSDVELFNGQNQKLLESWCVGVFGIGYSRAIQSCTVAINDGLDTDVDFRLKAADRVFEFQLTEVQEPERRRGLERKRPELKPTWRPVTDARRGRIEGPAWVARAVESKARKYGRGALNLNLLLYADFATDDLAHEDLVRRLEHFKSAFASIWVMDSIRICSTHSSETLGEAKGWHESRPLKEYYGIGSP